MKLNAAQIRYLQDKCKTHERLADIGGYGAAMAHAVQAAACNLLLTLNNMQETGQ